MLRDFIKAVENPAQVGKKGDVWFPHDSPEGGLPTLGYGHKLTLEENDNQQRSEEHTSELQSPCNLVCRLLLEKKKKTKKTTQT